MELTVNQRIKRMVDEFLKGNKLAFSKRVGMSNQALGEIVGDRGSNPSFLNLEKIAKAFPEVRTEWLLLGEGEMLKNGGSTKEVLETSLYMEAPADLTPEPPQRAQPTDNLRILTVQVAEDGDENIELVPVWAAAGYPLQRVEREYIRKLPSFRLPGAAFNNGTFRCFQVNGASMQGTLQDGDWIICRFVEKWAQDIRDNQVYVVVSETDILVKRVLNQLNERGRLTLHSDNPSFDVQEMDYQELREVWQGVARLTLDLTNTRLDLPTEFLKQQAVLAELLRRVDRLEERPPL